MDLPSLLAQNAAILTSLLPPRITVADRPFLLVSKSNIYMSVWVATRMDEKLR